MKTHVPCNLCGSDSTTSLFEKQCFNIVKCKKCGLVYVNPMLSEKEIEKYIKNRTTSIEIMRD